MVPILIKLVLFGVAVCFGEVRKHGQVLKDLHEIKHLPHYSSYIPINFRHYAGHIKLNEGQRMFYWLVEAEHDPVQAPLVLWLNGGPGCSSLGGFFNENGPFVVQGSLTIKRNRYAWNRYATFLYLESPAGVGFSTPHLDKSDYNDETTTKHIYEFLGKFFEEYPEYNGREFYVAGESYAGIYIPSFVNKLLLEPMQFVNLKGFMLGNPFTDATIDYDSKLDYLYTHGLLSLDMYRRGNEACLNGFSMHLRCLFWKVDCSSLCDDYYIKGLASVDVRSLNPYYIYGDVCLLQDGQAEMLDPTLYDILKPANRGSIEPCTDKFTQLYLTLPEVQTAIHANLHTPSNWSQCNHKIAGGYSRTESVLHLYPFILSHGLKVLIYSGDSDAVINFIGTERWINAHGLNLTITEEWHSWFGPDKQLAGYVEKYEGLTFKIVKGAGHMVPSTRPLHAMYMTECFLLGETKCAQLNYPRDHLEWISGGYRENEQFTSQKAHEESDTATANEAQSISEIPSVDAFAHTSNTHRISSVVNNFTIASGILVCILCALLYRRIQRQTGYMPIVGTLK